MYCTEKSSYNYINYLQIPRTISNVVYTIACDFILLAKGAKMSKLEKSDEHIFMFKNQNFITLNFTNNL